MSAHNALRKGLGVAYNVLSRQFLPDAVITLLKASQTYGEYDDVLEIESKRFFEYSNFRQNFLLEIADTSSTLTDAIAQATHVRIDDDIYIINQGDTTAPKGTDVTWKLYCDRFVDSRTHFGRTLGQ